MEDKDSMVQINCKIPIMDKEKLDILIAITKPKTNITKIIQEAIQNKVKEVIVPEQRS